MSILLDDVYVVTGGAGFIGSRIVKGLNTQGLNIVVVDDLTDGSKIFNLNDCDVFDYMDKTEFLKAIVEDRIPWKIKGISHQGAFVDTLMVDGKAMMENNYTYSKILLDYAVHHRIPFVYASSASVYGVQENVEQMIGNECPANVYAYSKYLFDKYAQSKYKYARSSIIGLRYFNVYGSNEDHKGPMKSAISLFIHQLKTTNTMKLFEGSDRYKRDFVHVEDVVATNMSCLLVLGNTSAIYNVGSTQARSFKEISNILIKRHTGSKIEYIPMPDNLKNQYQKYTCGNFNTLLGDYKHTTLEEGIDTVLKERGQNGNK